MSNKVGRPISKIDRKKVGFSLEGIYVKKLNELVELSSNSKSTIIEKAISDYYDNYVYNKNSKKKIEKENNISSFDKFRELLTKE